MFTDNYLMIDSLSLDSLMQKAESIKDISIKVDKTVVSMNDGSDLEFLKKPVLQKDGSRAMISINGPLIYNPTMIDLIRFNAVSTQEVMAAVEDVSQDNQISSVIFNINCCGGEATKMHVLANMVHSLTAHKSTASVNTGMMASAAYFIGSQASKVFVSDTLNSTGSIGTVTVLRDFSEAAKQAGIKHIKVATGPLKGAGMMGTPITAAMVESVQKKVDIMQGNFSTAVERMRPSADMSDGAEARSGQAFFFEDADRLGLVDGIKDIAQAFEFLEQGNRMNSLRRTI